MGEYRLFLSYCSKDCDYADMFEHLVNESDYRDVFDISRYTRDVRYRDSFVDFMDKISEHDVVVTIISDAYLKSQACMYEVSRLILDPANLHKFFYIVITERDSAYYSQIPTCQSNPANIFSDEGKISYIRYWERKKEKLEKDIDVLNGASRHIELLENIKRIEHILYYEIGPLMKYLSEHRCLSFLEMIQTGINRFFRSFEEYQRRNMTIPELSLEEKLERELSGFCSTYLYAPETMVNNRYYVRFLPLSMIEQKDRIFFRGKQYQKEEIYVGIREDGPSAWGYYVELPMGIWFRRTCDKGRKLYGWYKTSKDDFVYIENVGCGLETVEIVGDALVWKSYIAYDLDEQE